MEYIIETKNLTKTYSGKDAARDINIHIPKGCIYGLIGRNGAGKTTIMRMLSGLSNATSGSYSIFGKSGDDAKKLMRKVGVLIESPGIYPDLSGQENLKIKCIGFGIDPQGYVEDLMKLVGLGDVDRKKTAGSYSLGMRQRLGIALSLVGDPDLIILDEPINGLDPQGIVEVRQTLEKLRNEKGITIMISSHILDELSKLADVYGIIHEGRLLDEFTTAQLSDRCKNFICIRTDNNQSALRVLSGMGIKNAEIDDNGDVRVNEQLDSSALMAKNIIGSGLSLNEIFVNRTSLEDYYLSVTGGGHNG